MMLVAMSNSERETATGKETAKRSPARVKLVSKAGNPPTPTEGWTLIGLSSEAICAPGHCPKEQSNQLAISGS